MRWRWSWLSAVCESFLRNVYEGWKSARESLSCVVSVSVSPRMRFFDGSRTMRIASSSESAARGTPRISRTAEARTSSLLAFQSTRRETRPPSSRVELPPELARRRAAHARQRLERGVLGRLLQRQRVLEDGRVERVVAEHLGDHLADDLALLGRRVHGLAEPPVAEERDARDRVVQVRERRDGQHVARDLLRPLLDRAGEPRPPVAPRAPRKEAEVALGRRAASAAPSAARRPPAGGARSSRRCPARPRPSGGTA